MNFSYNVRLILYDLYGGYFYRRKCSVLLLK